MKLRLKRSKLTHVVAGILLIASVGTYGVLAMQANQKSSQASPVMIDNQQTLRKERQQSATPQNTEQIKTSPQDQQSEKGSANNQSSMSVTINGQDIEVPENGSIQQTTTTDNGQTNVTISGQNSSSGDSTGTRNTNHSSMRINTRSTSESTTSQRYQVP